MCAPQVLLAATPSYCSLTCRCVSQTQGGYRLEDYWKGDEKGVKIAENLLFSVSFFSSSPQMAALSISTSSTWWVWIFWLWRPKSPPPRTSARPSALGVYKLLASCSVWRNLDYSPPPPRSVILKNGLENELFPDHFVTPAFKKVLSNHIFINLSLHQLLDCRPSFGPFLFFIYLSLIHPIVCLFSCTIYLLNWYRQIINSGYHLLNQWWELGKWKAFSSVSVC